MRHICLYFQVHQPYRLNKYSFFNIGSGEPYFDENVNMDIMQRIVRNAYLPFNALLMKLIERSKHNFRVSFSLSGTAIEQMLAYAPETLDSFRALADTGCVEFLGETYAHSLAAVQSDREFRIQVREHARLVREIFGQMPQTFRNTELIYADHIAGIVNDLGFDTILAEGTPEIMRWRSPNFLYNAATCPSVKLLLKNGRLSDDIAFRFSDREWSEWPLSAGTYLSWIDSLSDEEQVVNLFMDYETFGEHIPSSSGIFAFMEDFITEAMSHGYTFITPQEAGILFPVRGKLAFPSYTSWADTEKDLSAWLGNDMQREAFGNLYKLEKTVAACGNDVDIKNIWERLQTSDHFYYMSTKKYADGDVHNYFSPYSSPFDAFINYMNVLSDFSLRIDKKLNPDQNKREFRIVG